MKILAGICVALLLILVFVPPGAGAKDKDDKQPCCFTNEAYEGVCQVTPGEEETCDTILKYLNTPDTVDKTYCGESRIRGGWQQTACDDDSD